MGRGGTAQSGLPPCPPFTDPWTESMMKEYTREELAVCTGENGKPALLCCSGLVYDVSNSYHWRGGRHHALHRAGTDLTAELKQAPHGAHLLDRVPVVGRLREE